MRQRRNSHVTLCLLFSTPRSTEGIPVLVVDCNEDFYAETNCPIKKKIISQVYGLVWEGVVALWVLMNFFSLWW